jgi:glycerol uptake facilitator protein
MASLTKKFLAEVIGTFFLVFIGTGSAVAAVLISQIVNPKLVGIGMVGGFGEWLGVSLAFGITVTILIYTIGKVSGAHFNPAVTLGLLSTGNISGKDSVAYIIAQCIGAVIGSICVYFVFGPASATVASLGATAPAAGISYAQAIIAELIGTFLLVFVVMGVAVDKKADPGFAGIAIGLAVAAAIFVLGPITGGSINPARTFGPYLIDSLVGAANLWNYFIIYIIGPIVGGILGALAYKGIASGTEECDI